MKINMLNVMIVSGFIFSTSSAYAANCLSGCPTGVNNGKTITRPIYTLKNNRSTKFADWVAYHVTPNTISGPSRKRKWAADPDLSSSNTLEPDDYRDAHAVIGTDRGHQVPLSAFSNTSNWSMTNYLSNITPQASNLNQGPWAKLETAIRDYVSQGNDVYVVTGPLYESYFASLPQADESHTIPSGYFKVVAEQSNNRIYTSAFIMYQDAGLRDNFCTSEVTIDEIESRAGIDIMPNLSSSVANSVEASTGGLSRELGCY
ncbi:DNA/RNA non-specific endonuclease [Vibrio mangrovi]|uniref:Nuclease n=1 Tax=Vibrio mangrovi TaxID=474394 RepID=A0A1Y6IWG6_9VIBR|nr:DNA/RNA non-specific endonuclease [Vibrio mangrovi]MDW6004544.1 DNA/RNA non-specific endonuclease [Vibrio mangrovi]SMS00832.1 Nuclease precursor [Vibrio mangrovi]